MHSTDKSFVWTVGLVAGAILGATFLYQAARVYGTLDDCRLACKESGVAYYHSRVDVCGGKK